MEVQVRLLTVLGGGEDLEEEEEVGLLSPTGDEHASYVLWDLTMEFQEGANGGIQIGSEGGR
jgi:hypothetical protein